MRRADMIRTEARLARQRHGFSGPRPQAPEPPPAGMTARVAAARAVAEAVTHARPLDEGMPKRSGMLEWTLVVGAAQILFLDAPDHAAVDLAVRVARSDAASAPFAGLANAVLRGIARE